ncbi:MAG TPA: hypothetical protein VMB66_00585 [Candidatus Acidoferrales bacterium]|nr:hypothetical protein [Candidatus Acidoferrales bacterium]
MSTIQEVSAEQLAKLFHHYHQALAHDCGQDAEQRPASWDCTSHNERRLMIAAARLTLLELSTTPAESQPGRKYYATPGEAEWGA